ncbi:hypothetical protein [Capnocytophaga stomatis]|uniref:hypothetical protein n=1 Tax=Capnocytophaga stomatis TaxID=1848904 RepID=UPI001BB31F82|nr:hypothetical protein [Capnocytophaga stomatis]
MNKSYFIQAFLIILLAALFFIGFKNVLPKRIFPETSNLTENVIVDSLMLEAISDSEEVELVEEQISDTITFAENSDFLSTFFKKLQELEESGKGSVRIGYFGDSMTDGDLIVQDLRQLFQDVYGGLGVGFVSITSESAATRGSVRHSYSNNWRTQSFVNVKNPQRPFGVSGRVSFVKDSTAVTWLEYKASGQKHVTEIYSPVLFYGSSENKKASVEISYSGDTTKVVKPLVTDKKLNALNLSDKNVKGLKIRFIESDSIPFYGINSGDKKGVHIDNFSSRGNSGLPLSLLNASLMQEFEKHLGGYDLIVLHFGANVLNYGKLDYSWYVRGMSKVVNQIKVCFPKASVLIVSSADKSTKYEMEMKTDLAVVPLVEAQQKYAEETQSGFINLYELMGGNGSMVKWVEAEPSLATKDYTHFNIRGSKKVAELIYNELMGKYQRFKETKQSKNIKAETVIEEFEEKIDTTEIKKDSIILKDTIEVKTDSILVPEEKEIEIVE